MHGRKQNAREEAEGTGGKEGGSGKDTKDQEDSFSFLRTAPLADVCKIRQRADSRKLNHLRSDLSGTNSAGGGQRGLSSSCGNIPAGAYRGQTGGPDRGHCQADRGAGGHAAAGRAEAAEGVKAAEEFKAAEGAKACSTFSSESRHCREQKQQEQSVLLIENGP
jgi:hypothetical protein